VDHLACRHSLAHPSEGMPGVRRLAGGLPAPRAMLPLTQHMTVEVTAAAGVTEIILSRPERLNVDEDVRPELLHALMEWGFTDGVGAMIFGSQGKVFSAGGDLAMMRWRNAGPAAAEKVPIRLAAAAHDLRGSGTDHRGSGGRIPPPHQGAPSASEIRSLPGTGMPWAWSRTTWTRPRRCCQPPGSWGAGWRSCRRSRCRAQAHVDAAPAQQSTGVLEVGYTVELTLCRPRTSLRRSRPSRQEAGPYTGR
jgi:hypothetical protein